MDQIDHLKGCTDLDISKDGMRNSGGANRSGGPLYEEKKAAIEAEVARVNQLPSNSSYAVHRMRVLTKLLHLMFIQVRTSLVSVCLLFDQFVMLSCVYLLRFRCCDACLCLLFIYGVTWTLLLAGFCHLFTSQVSFGIIDDLKYKL